MHVKQKVNLSLTIPYVIARISAKDRTNMLKSFSLDVKEGEGELVDDFENDCNMNEKVYVPYVKVNGQNNINLDTNRVFISESPKINVKIMKTVVTMVVDTGATGSITLDLCNEIGLQIYPSPHSAIQADGESRLNVVG